MANQNLSVRNNIGPANIVVPGTSAGLVSAAGLPGNTTGSAIASGYVGEIINGVTNANYIPTNTATFNAATITLNKGKYMLYGNLILLTPASVVAWPQRTNPFVMLRFADTSDTLSEFGSNFVLPGGTAGDATYCGTICHPVTITGDNTLWFLTASIFANNGGPNFTVYTNTSFFAVRIA